MERLGGHLRSELARLGPAGPVARIVDVWSSAVGPAVARNAWPARVGRDGTLHVATSSSTWAFELGLLARDIEQRLAERLGAEAPRALRFAPGRVPEPPAPESAASPVRNAPPPGDQERRQASELAARIENDALREIVARAAAAGLSRGRSGRRA